MHPVFGCSSASTFHEISREGVNSGKLQQFMEMLLGNDFFSFCVHYQLGHLILGRRITIPGNFRLLFGKVLMDVWRHWVAGSSYQFTCCLLG